MGKSKGGSSAAKGGKDEASAKPAKGAQKIEVSHILCQKMSRMEEAYAEIEASVRDKKGSCTSVFDTVARKYSEDKAKVGGKLGEKTKGSLVPEFEEVAFKLNETTATTMDLGKVKTSEGYHIIMVTKKK